MVSKQKPAPKLYPGRETVFAVLKLFGITRLTVFFAGQDKSGEITGINECKGLLEREQLRGITLDNAKAAMAQLSSTTQQHAINAWIDINRRIIHNFSLEGVLISMCYDMLEEMWDDWRYGEGSSGSITISTVRKRIKLDLDENIITTRNYKAQL